MNYVAAVLLMMLNEANFKSQDERELSERSSDNSPEETAFWILYALIRNQGMADVWRSKMPGYVPNSNMTSLCVTKIKHFSK